MKTIMTKNTAAVVHVSPQDQTFCSEEYLKHVSVCWYRPSKTVKNVHLSKHWCGQNKKDMNHPTFHLK